MSNNLPYINIYKGDFLRSNVSACSIAAQGLWLRLMILMHDSERTGYLCLNGKAMPPRMTAIKCSLSLDEYEPLLAELMSVSAFNTSREGIIFSPDIVAQAEDRAKNADRQKRFKEKSKGNAEGNGKVTPKVTDKSQRSSISSSSSSSSSDRKGEPPESQADYLLRKQLEFPEHDVMQCFENYIRHCKNNNRTPKRPFFDNWLANEYEPLAFTEEKTADAETLLAKKYGGNNGT